jgi:hypothetical protein
MSSPGKAGSLDYSTVSVHFDSGLMFFEKALSKGRSAEIFWSHRIEEKTSPYPAISQRLVEKGSIQQTIITWIN